ncbi:50S ribosomal protein L23 [Candidatus Woesebacteria bacterium]|nr:50S ribosomal protein L23 [Candidatus Woesebacteria bacterium]QQG47783.1 MAG: 50S ribosomal protein L23 [Candidatus Woesebacteria bacterium]
MKIKPVISEKSLNEAKSGKYTFLFPIKVTKPEIKKLVDQIFDVHVLTVKTITKKGGSRLTMLGKKQSIKSIKKAVVTLKEGEKIEIFDVKKEKSKKKK